MNSMKSSKSLLALISGLVFSGLISTSALAYLDDLDPEDICSASDQKTLKRNLAQALVQVAKVPWKIVDWNDSGVAYDEYVTAVTVALCARFEDSRKCKKSAGDTQSDLVF